MLNNLSQEPPIPFIGTVVKFDNQKEQVTGSGWGWRYKVALFDSYSSKESEIEDANIEYAIAMAGTSDGSGGSNFRKSLRISQGDTVVGFKYGGKRGVAIIFGVLARTTNTKVGTGRFDTKSGYFGELQPKGLFGSNQEFNDRKGHDTPNSKPKCSNKDKSVPAKRDTDKFQEQGLNSKENVKGQFKKPPNNKLTAEEQKEIEEAIKAEKLLAGEEVDGVTFTLS